MERGGAGFTLYLECEMLEVVDALDEDIVSHKVYRDLVVALRISVGAAGFAPDIATLPENFRAKPNPILKIGV